MIRITQVFVCLLLMMRMNLNMFQSVTRKQCTMPYVLCNPMFWQQDGLKRFVGLVLDFQLLIMFHLVDDERNKYGLVVI